MQNFGSMAGAVIALLLLALAPLVTAQCPSDSGDWLLYKDSCYKYFNESQFWFSAEGTCKESSGHLTSIKSDQENRLVAKMSFCKDVWIGRYAVNLRKLADVTSYEWSDESKGDTYDRLNFTEDSTIHRSLIRSVGLSWQNSLYHEQHPFVCKVPSTSVQVTKCPSSMRFYQDNCYLISGFEATFIEANFFCQNRSLQVASVLNEAELRFMNAMDLEVDACELQSTWLGLVKLNPCFPDRGGRELCYQWTDYSGKHLNFPTWAEGEPAAGGEAGSDQDCVLVSGNQLLTAKCNSRHKFVCKVPASSLTVGSPVWQILDEKPAPIDESKSENIEKAAPVVESSPIVAPTQATETTATPETVETPTTPEPTEATITTGTLSSDVPVAEAATPVPEAIAGSFEPTTYLNRRRREAPKNDTVAPSKSLPAHAKKPSQIAASKRPEQDENETVEDRFPWALSNLIASLFADEGKEAKASKAAQPKPTPMPTIEPPSLSRLPLMSPRDLEVDPAFNGHF